MRARPSVLIVLLLGGTDPGPVHMVRAASASSNLSVEPDRVAIEVRERPPIATLDAYRAKFGLDRAG